MIGMDIDLISLKLQNKAIMAAHLTGRPMNMEKFLNAKYNLIVIEDAANQLVQNLTTKKLEALVILDVSFASSKNLFFR